jgi:hypothetical protein
VADGAGSGGSRGSGAKLAGGSGGGGGGRAALTGAGSLKSNSRSETSAAGCAGFAAGGGGGGAPSRLPESGASPVSSAMPKRSSTSSRRSAPFGLCCVAAFAGRDAPGRTGPVPGRTGPVEGFTGPVEGRAAGLPAPPSPDLATAAAPSEDNSIVEPGLGVESAAAAPGLRTWKTPLHAVQRTLTPRSVTLSSAIRNFD